MPSAPYFEMQYLLPQVKTYNWGKKGSQSLTYQLWRSSRVKMDLDVNEDSLWNDAASVEETPFAELWYGTHPLGTSLVINPCKEDKSGILLDQFLAQQYGTGYVGTQQTTLPYMLKILSVATPLSLQCHPDKHHAQLLHKSHPEVYPDANHKPEMCIALTSDVRVLCGFRPFSQTYELITQIQELKSFYDDVFNITKNSQKSVGTSRDVSEKVFFQGLLEKSLTASFEKVSSLYTTLKMNSSQYFQDEKLSDFTSDALRVFLDLCRFYPNDSGCLAVFFLNVIHLHPGECVAIPSNVLHAYLSGDILECMASSDNVIRGGMTSKFKDIMTLLKIVDYSSSLCHVRLECQDLTSNYVQLSTVDQACPKVRVSLYKPPIEEFQVISFQFLQETHLDFPIDLNGHFPYIFLAFSGCFTVSYRQYNENIRWSKLEATEGSSVLIPAQCFFRVTCERPRSAKENNTVQDKTNHCGTASSLMEPQTLLGGVAFLVGQFA